MNRNILSFQVVNKPVQHIKSNCLVPGEVWSMNSAEEVKSVGILMSLDLYLDVISKHLQSQHFMEETNFSCLLDEDYHNIKEDDVYEVVGGTLAGIDVHGEYIELGHVKAEETFLETSEIEY